LEVEAYSDASDVKVFAEKSVVVSFAATYAVSVFVEGNSRNDD
jgi:hypothetical protein